MSIESWAVIWVIFSYSFTPDSLVLFHLRTLTGPDQCFLLNIEWLADNQSMVILFSVVDMDFRLSTLKSLVVVFLKCFFSFTAILTHLDIPRPMSTIEWQ